VVAVFAMPVQYAVQTDAPVVEVLNDEEAVLVDPVWVAWFQASYRSGGRHTALLLHHVLQKST
jgi:hypothetical protein